MSSRFLIETRAVEPFMKNGYILICTRTHQAAYIDPGDEAGEMLSWVDSQNLELVSILLTHGHMDHISGVSRVKSVRDVPILLHQEDHFLYNSLPSQGHWFGLEFSAAPQLTGVLEPGKTVLVGDLNLDVLHTPGHSPGSVCLTVDDHVFCGDLVFSGSIGRTDLPGGSHEVIIESIRSKILSLPDETILMPGHGPATTVGRERRFNPFLTGQL